MLCTSRNHLITSSSGLGPRGPPAQNGGVRRKGTGANPKVGIKLATEDWGARGEGVSQEAVGSFPQRYPSGNGRCAKVAGQASWTLDPASLYSFWEKGVCSYLNFQTSNKAF